MNTGYTQTNKKASMAAKMVTKYKMNGDTTGYGGGIKYQGHGDKPIHKGGMRATQNAKHSGAGKGMKATQEGSRPSFSTKKIYTQAC